MANPLKQQNSDELEIHNIKMLVASLFALRLVEKIAVSIEEKGISDGDLETWLTA